MVIHDTLALLIVALAAALMPGISRLIRLPAAVTEILLGIILGKSCLGLQFGGDWLVFLAHLGFLLLMFHAGMEIDFAILRRQSRTQLLAQFAIFFLTLTLSLLLAHLMGLGVFMALVLSTTSLGLVMPTLKELGLNKTALGQAILIAATLADFLTLLGITVFILWHKHGISWHFVYPLPLFIGFGLVLRLVRLWAWWHPQKAQRLLATGDNQELGVRLSLALLFLFVALSELVHIEAVLGAFLGGCVLSFVFRDRGDLEDKLSALGFGFLVPIFFINVGMQFDLANLLNPQAILFASKLLILALTVKILPSLLMVTQGASLRAALNIGILMATRLSLIVAAASIGVAEGLITPKMKDAVVLLAVLTCLIGPTLFKALHKSKAA